MFFENLSFSPFLADTPPVTDCLELQRLGVTQNGYYFIDPTGQRDNSKLALVFCSSDGWTDILQRDKDSSPTYVRI